MNQIRESAEDIIRERVISNAQQMGEYLFNARAVARAYLEEHPEDDDTPVDCDWLQSIGLDDFSLHNLDEKRWAKPGEAIVLVVSCARVGGWDHRLTCGVWPIKHDPTRGDVRRLIKALGIGEDTPDTSP